jgi:tetratricopeptide (TPR) repeat protein
MRIVVASSFCLLLSTGASAQDAAPTEAAPAAPAPAEAAPAAPTAQSVKKEAWDFLEKKANTRDNLNKSIELHEKALGMGGLSKEEQVRVHCDISLAYLRLGDLGKKPDAMVRDYEKGRAAASKGIALDPRHADAHFWEAANQASIGSARGVLNSLFMVPELKEKLGKVLKMNPNHHFARDTLAKIFHEVPGLMGGSDSRAEKELLEIMKRDPNWTPSMITLGNFYADKGKYDEARKWYQKVLDAKKSSKPHDLWKFNKPDAKKGLKRIEGK